jgi:hypothetical protein
MASLYLVDTLDGVTVGGQVSLDGAEGRHAVTVSRVRPGERLRLSDGRGAVVAGAVASVGKDSLVLTVDAVDVESAPRPSLTLVQALAKGGRDEMAVQAATEIGVDRVVPWAAARSVSRWDGAKVEKGRARWAAIAQEAAKQAVRSRVPEVVAPVTTAQLAGGAGSAHPGPARADRHDPARHLGTAGGRRRDRPGRRTRGRDRPVRTRAPRGRRCRAGAPRRHGAADVDRGPRSAGRPAVPARALVTRSGVDRIVRPVREGAASVARSTMEP